MQDNSQYNVKYTFCCNQKIIQYLHFQGFWRDDSAANYVEFRCSAFTDVTEQVLDAGSGIEGVWGSYSDVCSANSAVCGMRINFEDYSSSNWDQTAMSDAKFYCCQ